MSDLPDDDTRLSRRRRQGDVDDATVLSSRSAGRGVEPDDETVLSSRSARRGVEPDDATVLSSRAARGNETEDATVLSSRSARAEAVDVDDTIDRDELTDRDDTVLSPRTVPNPASDVSPAAPETTPRRASAPQTEGQIYRARADEPVRVPRSEPVPRAPGEHVDHAARQSAARRRTRTRAVVALVVASIVLIGATVALIAVIGSGA
ncbi:hypothetical protein [Microbacterium sp. C7(2022)]|uniref:hypothetical protein n=1 Tax=Microbacterium sp. C7(2022) TaxID=2992759 RepID=UPI00237B31E8|nr:hypothetical protein [Microbacterium sp. C7(2022)]MDE0545310.1 hypothetical protein [Microbacterium sp. C7(2022)]